MTEFSTHGPPVRCTPYAMTKAELGVFLRRKRIEAGFNIPDASRALGLHAMTLYAWEQGRNTPSALSLLAALALYRVRELPLCG